MASMLNKVLARILGKSRKPEWLLVKGVLGVNDTGRASCDAWEAEAYFHKMEKSHWYLYLSLN